MFYVPVQCHALWASFIQQPLLLFMSPHSHNAEEGGESGDCEWRLGPQVSSQVSQWSSHSTWWLRTSMGHYMRSRTENNRSLRMKTMCPLWATSSLSWVYIFVSWMWMGGMWPLNKNALRVNINMVQKWIMSLWWSDMKFMFLPQPTEAGLLMRPALSSNPPGTQDSWCWVRTIREDGNLDLGITVVVYIRLKQVHFAFQVVLRPESSE